MTVYGVAGSQEAVLHTCFTSEKGMPDLVEPTSTACGTCMSIGSSQGYFYFQTKLRINFSDLSCFIGASAKTRLWPDAHAKTWSGLYKPGPAAAPLDVNVADVSSGWMSISRNLGREQRNFRTGSGHAIVLAGGEDVLSGVRARNLGSGFILVSQFCKLDCLYTRTSERFVVTVPRSCRIDSFRNSVLESSEPMPRVRAEVTHDVRGDECPPGLRC